ncbi:MAG TPA: LacI family DNA-binding transcriptional regulator [Pseudonocardiaceae bacterium]
MTLADVAERAGVSLATASRVLGGSNRVVGGELRDAVHRAAAELGYSANLQARAVARGTSDTMGVVVHDIADPYFSTIAAGVMEVAYAGSMVVSLTGASADTDRELAFVAMMRAQRARALVLIGSRTDNVPATEDLRRELRAFTRSGGRVVCVGQDVLGVDTVRPQNADGARNLARALVGQGHRDFVILAGPPGLRTAQDRVAGFQAGLADRGIELPDSDVIPGPFTRDGGYEAAGVALAGRAVGRSVGRSDGRLDGRSAGRLDGSDGSGRVRPLCLFAVNDVMAVGALAYLRVAGVAVPDEVAVAGFDDIPTLQDITPSLSTVALPLFRMGEMAARLALRPPDDSQPRVVPISGQVLLRQSSATRLH